ncbi:MAG: chemotaxis protein CheW [Candidatus Manganitrophaceae bacterium]
MSQSGKIDQRAGEDRRRSNGGNPGGNPDGPERRTALADRRHGNNRQYATFFLEGHFFGVEVEKVQEVFKGVEMTPVPLCPAVIAGLINLRGEIVTTLDLRLCLGFSPRPQDRLAEGITDGADIGKNAGMNVVVRTPEGPVNLLVDRIGDVVEVRPDLFAPPPQTLDPTLRKGIQGVYRLQDRLLLALNTDAVIEGMA